MELARVKISEAGWQALERTRFFAIQLGGK